MNARVQTTVVSALAVLGILLGAYLLYRLASLVILVLIAVVLATAVDAYVQRLQGLTARWWRMPRGLAVALVMIAGLLMAGTAVGVLGATAAVQAQEFSNSFLQYTWPTWSAALGKYAVARGLSADPGAIIGGIAAQSQEIRGYIFEATQAVVGLLGGIFSALLVLIFVLLFVHNKAGILGTVLQLVPPVHRARVRLVGDEAAHRMSGWLSGVFSLSVLITGLSTVGMWALHIPYALLIGICGGIGEFIPMVGVYAAMLPAIIIVVATYGVTSWQLVAVIVFFAALLQFENYFLAPRIMQRHVGISPVTTILAVLVGASLLGVLGVVLAVPLAAAGRVVMRELVFPAIEGRLRPVPEEAEEQPAGAGRA
jgi:predicted PurR-regulated permease PerM